MAGRRSKADNRGTDLFGLLVSGKSKEFHTFRSGEAGGGGGAFTGMTATGGVVSDYVEVGPGTVYRAHVFTASGALQVTQLATGSPNEIEYIIVGGGGGGGFDRGGGGGAGAFYPGSLTASVQTYPVQIGGGGQGSNVAPVKGGNGGTTTFGLTTVKGGGGGGSNATGQRTGNDSSDPFGGSGGGGAQGSTVPYDGGSSGTYGNDGGPAGTLYWGGGGGGAGGAARAPTTRVGGLGVQNGITGITTTYAGGGGAGGDQPGFPGGPDDGSGGGSGNNGGTEADNNSGNGTNGVFATGSGGGGGSGNATNGDGRSGGAGGSGIVVARYQIGALEQTAKASGGAISFYDNKTIHTFTQTGSFEVPASFNETVEYVVIGGGGAGGGPSEPGDSYYGGGGGAGAYRKGVTVLNTPQTIAVQVGGGGAKGSLTSIHGTGSASSFGPTIPAAGGGFGATWQDSGSIGSNTGGAGGSSGGANYGGTHTSATGDTFNPKNAAADTPSNGWGHDGGAGYPTGDNGGGGGAGGIGEDAADSNGGDGGLGMQLPATFRNPASTVGAPGPTNTSTHNPGWTGIDDSGKFWVAGGGGGGAYGPDTGHDAGVGGVGSPSVGSSPFAGAGNGSRYYAGGTAALQNTGSGGGGMERAPGGPDPQNDAGNGGSGLVLIAYPT